MTMGAVSGARREDIELVEHGDDEDTASRLAAIEGHPALKLTVAGRADPPDHGSKAEACQEPEAVAEMSLSQRLAGEPSSYPDRPN
jgi:hypothetical protein